jgi:hypothetical protein
MNILSYTFEAYIEWVQSFHGFAAPGVVITLESDQNTEGI